MRLRYIETLANSKTKHYKKRTILTIAPICILFGTAMALLLIVSSLRATISGLSRDTNPKIYVNIREGKTKQNLKDALSKYDAEIINFTEGYFASKGNFLLQNESMDIGYMEAQYLRTAPDEIIKPYITENYSDNEIPIVVTTASALKIIKKTSENIQSYTEALGRTFDLDICYYTYEEDGIPKVIEEDDGYMCDGKIRYKIVGIVPNFRSQINDNEKDDNGIVDSLISSITGASLDYILVEKTSEFSNNYSNLKQSTAPIVASFNNIDDLFAFKESYACEKTKAECNSFYVSEYFGNAVSTQEFFNGFIEQLSNLLIILAIASIAAYAINISKIINDDYEIMNLYEIVGASKKDIFNIYLLYVLKNITYTLILSISISLLATVVIFFLKQASLSRKLITMFAPLPGIENISTFILPSPDIYYFGAMSLIVLSGLIGFTLSMKHLMNKRK